MVTGKSFIILVIAAVGVLECMGDMVVETDAGSFRGTAAADGDYFEFLGIPYGKVNEGNPFGTASAYPVVSGTYDANHDDVKCPQVEPDGTITGSLDCLRLNVYVPATAIDASQFPVMVYIHGGFFSRRHASKDVAGPKFLVRHDVIVVTINYRLGPYGFMCLNRRAVPGNQGLKDQVLALKWIKEHIEAFGGNPNQTTLLGQSAGAHSVDLHLLSENENLYSKVILQSGSSLAQTVLYEPDREAPVKIASYLELEHSTVSEALSSISNAPTDDVIKAASQLNIEFKPCTETKFENVEPFITDYWVNSPVPKAQSLPIMIGFTEYETLTTHINADSDHFQRLANFFYNSLNHTFDFDEERLNRMEGYMRRFYLGDSAINQDVAWQIINFVSDHLYNHPIQRTIKKFVESGAGNIFYYLFTYSGGRNAASVNNLNVQAASHGDDLRYLFDSSSLPTQVSAEDQVIIDRMTTMWTNFAKYSDPTPETTTLLPVKWVPLTGDTYHFLKIDSEFTMERRPFHRRMAFWDLFLKLNGGYQRSYDAAVAAADEDDDDDDSSGTISSGRLLNVLLALVFVAVLRQ